MGGARRWSATLDRESLQTLLAADKHGEIAARAVAIEARTNLLFSFEKMALRDAVKSAAGARAFAHGLYDFLHGFADMETQFTRWCDVVGGLPRRQTRVLTWPVVTVVGSIAQPQAHIFLKPTVIREAARRCGIPFHYRRGPHGRPMPACSRWRASFERTARPAAARHDRRAVVPMGRRV